MGLIREFRDFIIKGNAIDMAVGIIIGGVFTPVVKSLVDDIIMPPIGFLVGGMDFSQLHVTIVNKLSPGDTHPVWHTAVTKELPAVVISYGKFINTVIALLITGFAVFLLVKSINTARKRFEKQKEVEAAAPAVPPADVQLLTEIRDLLKSKA